MGCDRPGRPRTGGAAPRHARGGASERPPAVALRCGSAFWGTGATVLLGSKGTGKSTTLVRLTSAGWSPVCEDFGWLDPRALRLYGWDREVRLLPDALERLGPLPTSPARVVADPKLLLSYADLEARHGVRRLTSAPLQRFVFLRRERDHAGGSGPESFERTDAVPALWQDVGLPLGNGTRRFMAEQIGALLQAVEVRAWSVGVEPLSALWQPA